MNFSFVVETKSCLLNTWSASNEECKCTVTVHVLISFAGQGFVVSKFVKAVGRHLSKGKCVDGSCNAFIYRLGDGMQ